LGLNNESGGNNTWIRKKVSQLQLSTEHFTGQGHLKGKTHSWSIKIPLEEILVEGSDYINGQLIKTRLFKEGLLENKCYECGILPEWNSKPITLQLDHINGNHYDNRIETFVSYVLIVIHKLLLFVVGRKRLIMILIRNQNNGGCNLT
jgi:hypothetical protein